MFLYINNHKLAVANKLLRYLHLQKKEKEV